jgi:hypothetical protein
MINFVTAQGLKALRDKADHLGGKFTFDRLREREGLGPETINKTRVSRLLSILEKRSDVERWRANLSDKQRFDWASPEAVWNHCQLFHSASGGSAHAQQRPSRAVELERINAELHQTLTAWESGVAIRPYLYGSVWSLLAVPEWEKRYASNPLFV